MTQTFLPPPRIAIVVVLFVCLLATLRKNFLTDLHEIFREGLQWAVGQQIKNFGGDPDYRLGLGIVFPGFDTIAR